MSQNQATELAVAYPPPPASTGPSAYSAPPPAGYPTMDGQTYQQDPIPVETKSRGDGFWKGCCAALCCCCALDICF
nr:cysteine-rich and transmembrane domain-containing protein WIH1-like [Populus alba]